MSPTSRAASPAAETGDEVKELIGEAIEFHLQGLREDGDPVPEPTSRVAYVQVVAHAA